MRTAPSLQSVVSPEAHSSDCCPRRECHRPRTPSHPDSGPIAGGTAGATRPAARGATPLEAPRRDDSNEPRIAFIRQVLAELCQPNALVLGDITLSGRGVGLYSRG